MQPPRFNSLPDVPSFPRLEEEVLAYWRKHSTYEESLQRRADGPPFVFYEGPPTANGMPHPGHCLTRAIKDLFPRYRTMRGYRCERKAGWDTHGLPVEVEVCKELGIHSKEEIEQHGVEPFIQLCQRSVWRYMAAWEELTERLGFWIKLDDAYVTYHQSYVESVWWSLKQLFDRGLLYQGHKIVWWWAQGGTALSAGEVGQGYREVADPSVYVRFPLLDAERTSLLVWTTTPWTLPSNQFAAVHPTKIPYVVAVHEATGERLILAEALVESVAAKSKQKLKVESKLTGEDLIGRRYRPPFDYYFAADQNKTGALRQGGRQPLAWRVVGADFVTTESGTGIVHQAPAFGEVDFEVLQREQQQFVEGDGPPLICAVGPDGKFTAEAPDYQGRWVKDCDRDIARDLRERGLLFLLDQYLHDYPFCWRADDDPLIQYPRRSWFIRTSQFKQRMLDNNRKIGWQPEHIRDGRFGNFLETNVDWALSRERYWGTPLPIWVCEQSGQMEAVGNYQELREKAGAAGFDVWEKAKRAQPELVDDLRIHKPYIDAVTYDSPFAAGARMRRVTEVIDCWYDSGAMPFAQWGFPQTEGSAAHLAAQFPADFISEALDQTRGWFYSLLAISTLLFDRDGADPRLIDGLADGDTEPTDTASTDTASTDTASTDTASTDTASTDTDPNGDGVAAASDARSSNSKLADGAANASAPLDIDFPHPYRNCIVLGLMLSEAWVCEKEKCGNRSLSEQTKCDQCGARMTRRSEKMSKKLRNYQEPQAIFDTLGADALRWYFFANQPPWTSMIYSERAISESTASFRMTLWNVFKFFAKNADDDGFSACLPGDLRQGDADSLAAGKHWRAGAARNEMDRWILGELNNTCLAAVAALDRYDNYSAAQGLSQFLESLSNWWLRRSRRRFWSNEKKPPSQDKWDAYWTLYESLLTLVKLAAPFVPFLTESLWQALTSPASGERMSSVHFCDYPAGDAARVDASLSQRMGLVREIASLGLSARAEAKIRVRQPLRRVELILNRPEERSWLASHEAVLRDELNVKEICYTERAEQYVQYLIQPNFKKLGPRVGKRLPALKSALQSTDGASLLNELRQHGRIELEIDGQRIELDSDDLQIRLQARQGWTAAAGAACVVVLDTELSDELLREGLARDFNRHAQMRRRAIALELSDRIVIGVVTSSERIRQAITENLDYLRAEALANQLTFEALADCDGVDVELDGESLTLFLKKASSP